LRDRRGDATQRTARQYFIGLPDMVVNYFKFVAGNAVKSWPPWNTQLTSSSGHTELLDMLRARLQAAQARLVAAAGQFGLISNKPILRRSPQRAFDKGRWRRRCWTT